MDTMTFSDVSMAIVKLERSWTPDKGDILPYIFQNVYRDAVDIYRQTSRRKKLACHELPEEELPGKQQNLDTVVMVRDALEGLPEFRRRVVELKMEGRTNREIGEVLDISESLACTEYNAALSQLNAILTRGDD